MSRPVKPHSTYRQEQAAATRERIAEAARRLFATAGYGSTSMEAIAAEAGVAVRTVYAAFGAKRQILSLICERWLEQARARGRAAGVLAEPDPARRLRAAAGWLRALYAAGFDVEESGWTPDAFERWVGDALERFALGGQAEGCR